MHFLYDTSLAALIGAFNDKDCDWLWHCGQWAVWFGVLCHPLMHPWYAANTFSLLLLLFYPFKTCPLFKILLSFVLVSSPASFLWDLLVEAVMWTDTGLPCLSSRWCYFEYVCHAAGPLQDVPWSEGERNVIRSPTGGLHIRTCRHSCLSSAAFSICVLFDYLMKINPSQRSSSPLQEQHYIALCFICALMCVLKMTLCHFNTTSSYMKLTYVCQTHRDTRWLLRLSHFASPPSPLEDIWKTLRAKKAFKWHTNLSASKLFDRIYYIFIFPDFFPLMCPDVQTVKQNLSFICFYYLLEPFFNQKRCSSSRHRDRECDLHQSRREVKYYKLAK